MAARLHISCPLSVSTTYLQRVKRLLDSMHHTWTCWSREMPSVYDDNWIKIADAVVFILPNNAWTMSTERMPPGILREFQMCTRLNKKAFLVYETNAGELKIYEAWLHTTYISGNSGSSDVIKTYTRQYDVVTAAATSVASVTTAAADSLIRGQDKAVLSPDRRLLLGKR